MHQHPRPPPVTASPATSEQTNPARTNNSRDRDLLDSGTTPHQVQGSESSDEPGFPRPAVPASNSTTDVSRLNQVIQNFHTKAALIILRSRVDLPLAYKNGTDTVRFNRWFNVEIEETEAIEADIRRWKKFDVTEGRPPPMVIELFLTADELASSQSLVILDSNGKKWDVNQAFTSAQANQSDTRQPMPMGKEIILERWTVKLGDHDGRLPADLANLLPIVYKKSIVLFRSLFACSRLLPAWKFSRGLGKSWSSGPLKLKFRIRDHTSSHDSAFPDNLRMPLMESAEDTVSEFSFGNTDSPVGSFSVDVSYRINCDFRIEDSEAFLSDRLLGTDDEIFRPSLPSETKTRSPRNDVHEVGSLPAHRKAHLKPEDLGLAYGSLSTFHQVGPAAGLSPITMLKKAHDLGSESPEASPPGRTTFSKPLQTSRPSLRPLEGVPPAGRRTSISFQPFKTASLSASPAVTSPLASSPRTSFGKVPVLSSLNEAQAILPSQGPSSSLAQNEVSRLPDPAVVTSTSSSPKPTSATTRYSSSFSHRKARLSSGGTNRTEDDQNSSGRGSATSSAAQPGSGLLTEVGGGSSGSAHDDGASISDFLKMLDTKKGLMSPSDTASLEASARRTAAALNRFHRMREPNRELSESMNSSVLLRAGGSSGSSSQRLSSVPTMIPATSVSTSSSPGKPISPHTPHTPAIPSRLSAASNIDYSHQVIQPEPVDLGEGGHSSLLVETPSDDTAMDASNANVSAIPIPTSPRTFLPGYRRSSSVAQRTIPLDYDDLADPYGPRPASMDARERQPRHRPVRSSQQQRDDALGSRPGDAAANVAQPSSRQAEASPRRSSMTHKHAPAATFALDEGGSGSVSGSSPPHHPYRPRVSGGRRGRGDTPPQGSSSSLRGRDSGSAMSDGRGRGSSFSRPEARFDDEEPFLFTFSDIDASRRSLEEAPAPLLRSNQTGQDFRGGGAPETPKSGPPGAYPGWH